MSKKRKRNQQQQLNIILSATPPRWPVEWCSFSYVEEISPFGIEAFNRLVEMFRLSHRDIYGVEDSMNRNI